MRVAALLGLHADRKDIRPFEVQGLHIFSGNDLDASDAPDAALILGGDGTVHRYLRALSANLVPTMVIPLGSANDFAKSMGIESVESARDAWLRFCTTGENIWTIDLGTITELDKAAASEDSAAAEAWQGDSLETLHFVPDGPRRDLPKMAPRIMQSQLRRSDEAQRQGQGPVLYSCIAGTGLDAAVNRLTLEQPRWVRGHGGYVLALLQVLARFQPPRITVAVEADGAWKTVIDEPGFLVAVGNGPQYGSGMRLTHRAQMDDGVLDVCFVRRLSKLRLLRLFHVVFSGGHIAMPEVEYFNAKRVLLQTDPVSEVFADGEYICRTPVAIGIQRQALRVIVPQP